ncbi:MAG TPA: alpha-ketoglutarate-dependent dioxygenase AlkB [Chitinophagaceae bacterium]|nr:alpha-ketoglutarate-dependent dioxygenase AlkB [Chitinophagaceae bacterium]
MDLFNSKDNKTINRLPKDGELYYYDSILSAEMATNYFRQLMQEIQWQQDEVYIFGKHIFTKREVAWYGEKPFTYTYSGITKKARPWTPTLNQMKALVEQESGQTYNSCLLNLYHNGNEGMNWHSDDEKDLAPYAAIASVSLGAARPFAFKHKQSKEKVKLQLHHGSLLVMKGETQRHWLHSLPKSQKVIKPRINLTFRQIAK